MKLEASKDCIEQKQLFTSNYVEEIHNLSIRLGGSTEAEVVQIATDIDNRLFLESRWQDDLKVLMDKIQDAEDDKARLLISKECLSRRDELNSVWLYFKENWRI